MTEISSERLRDRFDRFTEIGATERGGVSNTEWTGVVTGTEEDR